MTNAARKVGSNKQKKAQQQQQAPHTPEKRGASVSFPSVQDCANVKSDVHVHKNAEANKSSSERDTLEGARFNEQGGAQSEAQRAEGFRKSRIILGNPPDKRQ